MTKTPFPKKKTTQAWLEQQFDENGWQERLASYTKIERHNSLTPTKHGLPKGTLTIGHEYYDTENKRVALIFRYETPDKTLVGRGRLIPKGLLIDEVWHYV